MAGAGKKTFASGEVLTASDVNGYLMDQAVMKFADSSARGSAIAAPSEGMVTYLDDTDRIEVYDGSAWQVVGNAFRMRALTGTYNAGTITPVVDGADYGLLTITLPTGFFTQPPRVFAQIRDVLNDFSEHAFVNVSGASTASVTLVITNAGPGTAAAGGASNISLVDVDVLAVQMTAGSALG